MIDPAMQQAIEQVHGSEHKLVFDFAGAGSLALFWLHSVAGSSRTILEATDRYSEISLAELLGRVPDKFVSNETANAMASAAYRRARHLAGSEASVLGVACTAALTTDRPRRGEHRCFVAVRDRAGVTAWTLALIKGERDRLAEETVVSQILIRAIAHACGVSAPVTVATLPTEHLEKARHSINDPIDLLFRGLAGTVVISADGTITADQLVRGAILSGSFNPLHPGHEQLAEAAARVTALPPVFEMPILNADKGALREAEIERRVMQFRGRYDVVLSRATLFVEKARLFPGSVFVVGYDTAARVVESRYYGDEKGRDASLSQILSAGCRFLVAGRLHNDNFQTVRDISVPRGFEGLFVELPESAFRIDLSSSQIREGSAAAPEGS